MKTKTSCINSLVSITALAALFLPFSISAKETTSTKVTTTEWSLGPFVRPANAQPVIRPNPASTFKCPMRKTSIAWEARHTFNPAAIVRNDKIHVLYRAEDDQGANFIGSYTSRIGMAISTDGIHVTTAPTPVFFPADDDQKQFEWTGGCEDPRLAEGPDGTYILTYTQYSGVKGIDGIGGGENWRIGLATSKDLRTWKKHGSPFTGTPFENTKIKSAAILSEVKNGRLIAAKHQGKFWMYSGESSVNLATSDDLVRWTPMTDSNGGLHSIMGTRKGFFDAKLTEVGPPPILTDKGIVLIYNGKNGEPGVDGDSELGAAAYACGQALFDRKDPSKLITRLDKPFFKPEIDWEKSGQYVSGTTFAEGLVYHQGKWFLYYGCADTFVGVSIYNPTAPRSGFNIPPAR